MVAVRSTREFIVAAMVLAIVGSVEVMAVVKLRGGTLLV